MDTLSSLSPIPLALLLVLVGSGAVAAGLRALSVRRRDNAYGPLVAVDSGNSAVLRSYRYRLSGRPDVVRRLPDGHVIPIEVKSRPTPLRGPYRSHLVQLWAYCLLVEETTGRPPPFGVLRYSDGEFRVRWDADARRELLAVRAELDRPYDGRATPSPARCARCPWRAVCDVRARGP